MTAIENLDERRHNEVQRRVVACMADRGFDYEPVPYYNIDTAFERIRNPLNRAVAERFGYHVFDALPPAPTPVDETTLGAAYLIALQGTEDDQGAGCLSQSLVAVSPAADSAFADVQAALNGLAEAVAGYEATTDGVARLRSWSECMHEAGYVFDSQTEPLNQFMALPSITDDELAVRQADLECDLATGLTVSRSAWQRDRFQSWLESDGAAWTEVLAQVAAAGQDLAVLEAEQL